MNIKKYTYTYRSNLFVVQDTWYKVVKIKSICCVEQFLFDKYVMKNLVHQFNLYNGCIQKYKKNIIVKLYVRI